MTKTDKEFIADLRAKAESLAPTTLALYSGREFKQAMAIIDAQAKLIDDLRGFAQDVMTAWPLDGVDGGSLQDTAVRHRLLVETQALEPCGESCHCAEYTEFPTTCFRKTELLTGIAMSEAKPK